MTPFTVATLDAPGGGKAAIGINGSNPRRDLGGGSPQRDDATGLKTMEGFTHFREHLIGRMGGPITFRIRTGGKLHEI